ncbi:CPM [Cordylochernes scorpioides]|uniref:CPM n=1 Tax=Cordylochernes scorpioides TaxID=51811 RepID=A0ABY6L5G3_9ARAC|nr:CPM [Cordylochernes scorpioides]
MTGRELWTLKIAANPDGDHLLKPQVKYIGNMHGNEGGLYSKRFTRDLMESSQSAKEVFSWQSSWANLKVEVPFLCMNPNPPAAISYNDPCVIHSGRRTRDAASPHLRPTGAVQSRHVRHLATGQHGHSHHAVYEPGRLRGLGGGAMQWHQGKSWSWVCDGIPALGQQETEAGLDGTPRGRGRPRTKAVEPRAPRMPKAYIADRRGNAKGYDLNRNFPDYFDSGPSKAERQPETLAIMSWLSRESFVLSGNLHGGAVVASYPFDNLPSYALLTGGNSPTPDDDIFRHIATVYASSHRTMAKERPCRQDSRFHFINGTTNGAQWYPLSGGMQDYNYVNAGCMEVTFEISCCKYPHRSQLPKFWNQNRQPLLLYLAEAHQGVKGIVHDPHGQPIQGATVLVKGREFGFHTSPRGEYWRILRPGTYILQVGTMVRAEGYAPVSTEIHVGNQQVTIQNLTMTPVRRVS